MNSIVNPITANVGPLVNVTISLPPHVEASFIKNGIPVPAPFVGTGLLDTGASRSVISPAVSQQLGAQIIGPQFSRTMHGISPSYTCYVNIALPNLPNQTFDVTIAGINFSGFCCLIGRDILDQGKFTYDGRNQTYELEF